MKTADKTRQANRRARMREQGFVLKQIWVHPDDWPAIKRQIEAAKAKRFKS